MSFSSLGLTPELQRAVDDAGYTEPSPIQAKAIPACLEGRDVLAAAQTGTGKTAGFTLPILQRLSARAYTRNRPVRALILAPTRELAAQVHASVEQYGQYLNPRLKSEVVFGGVKINPQIERLRDGVDILVACPGRLLDLVGQRAVRLDQVETLVLDEADRMLDMGFLRDIKRVLALLPAKRQNLLFSATFSKEIRTLTQSILKDPVTIEVAPRNAAAESVSQAVYKVPKPAKSALLIHLIKQHEWKQVLVFTATKHMANRVTQRLEKAGISAAAIHGNKSQNARTNALAGFKSGTVEVLVATDVAARGIDISQLPNVINFELPNVPADYVHRIGRTGRAGASGQAVSLVSPDEQDQLRQIERLISKPIEVIAPEGFDPSTVVVEREPERPPRQPRGQGRRGAPQSARSGTDQRNGGNGNSGNNANGERRRRRPSSQAQNGNR